ncbi:MAG: hypothetical protein IT393_09835 [Nitrospirae bacterium]|nr:hypothetical protein [Nitrospirota bacterium]
MIKSKTPSTKISGSKVSLDSRDLITDRVNAFYNEMPFNYSDSVQSFVSSLRTYNPIKKNYHAVHKALDSAEPKRIADAGSGTGWFFNCVAYHYKLNVTGIDLCSHTLDRNHISQFMPW